MSIIERNSIRAGYDLLVEKSGQVFAAEVKAVDSLAHKVPVVDKYITAFTKHARAGYLIGSGKDVYSNEHFSTFSSRLKAAFNLEVAAVKDLATSFIETRKVLNAKMA